VPGKVEGGVAYHGEGLTSRWRRAVDATAFDIGEGSSRSERRREK
jgi:hypothetical protein